MAIAALKEEDSALHAAFRDALREAEGQSHLVRDTGRYPLCGRGDINTYAIFAELKRSLIGPRGRVGMIVPSGIATDDTTKWFFQDLTEKETLASLFDFQSGPGLFPEIGHARFKFCLLFNRGFFEWAFPTRARQDHRNNCKCYQERSQQRIGDR